MQCRRGLASAIHHSAFILLHWLHHSPLTTVPLYRLISTGVASLSSHCSSPYSGLLVLYVPMELSICTSGSEKPRPSKVWRSNNTKPNWLSRTRLLAIGVEGTTSI